jgi:hypothetical protein
VTRWGALLLVLALACEPSVHGRCTQSSDCRAGVSCVEEGAELGICVAASGSCSPACASGELCSAGSCAVLKPVVSVTIDPSTFLSPQGPQVTVHVEASPQLALGSIAVEVDTTQAVASGVVNPPSNSPGSLGAYGAVAGVPISPVLDVRGSFGVAYVALDDGVLVAVETPSPPLAAGNGVRPRADRDSCNSRSEGFACP